MDIYQNKKDTSQYRSHMNFQVMCTKLGFISDSVQIYLKKC